MEARVKKLETIVERLLRRSKSKSTKAMITPYPISNAVFGDDIKGPIIRYMFPCQGTINKGLVRLGGKPKGGVRLTIQVETDLGGDSKEFIITRRSLIVEPKMDIDSGNRLVVLIEPVDEGPITEVWASFLWTPTMKDVDVKKFLVEDLERDLLEEGN